jgi:hypothetical protein
MLPLSCSSPSGAYPHGMLKTNDSMITANYLQASDVGSTSAPVRANSYLVLVWRTFQRDARDPIEARGILARWPGV